MLTVAEATGAPWVACARSDAERQLARGKQPVEVRLDGEMLSIHYVNTTPEEYTSTTRSSPTLCSGSSSTTSGI